MVRANPGTFLCLAAEQVERFGAVPAVGETT